MRELKFRFVDTGDGTVYKPITLVELCQRIEIPRRIVLESENGEFVDTDDFLDQLENGELIAEQYTGLKDKNGKEIYVGDIVDYNDDGECIGVVEYDAPEFCLNADATNWARMFLKGAPHQRVIGNIYENPELVKEKE